MRLLLTPSAALLVAASCAEPAVPLAAASETHLATVDVIDLLADDPDDIGISGVMRDNATGAFITNGGAHAFSATGEKLEPPNVPLLPRAENGNLRPRNEIMPLDGGRFVLLSDDAGFLWDRASGQLSEHFCVVPRNGDLFQRNGALAVQAGASDGLIAVAPRWYQPEGFTGEERLTQQLGIYRASDGTLLQLNDASVVADIEGLAWTDDGEELFAVAGASLFRLDREGRPQEHFVLDGLEDPRGLVRDGNVIYVAERFGSGRPYDRILAYDLGSSD